MNRLLPIALLLAALALLPASCSQTKKNRTWEAGDTIICPHCGKDFTVPEKLGE